MNGTQFMYPRFTLPASANTSQMRWDFAFLSKEEFEKKYPADYEAVKQALSQ